MKSVEFDGKRVIPSKIVCVGRNYVEHVRELNNEVPGEPVLFIKPNSALSPDLLLPDEPCRYEGEISLLMVDGSVAGVAFGLDLTLGQVQERLKAKGLPWEKAKAFNHSAVFSPFVAWKNLDGLRLELWINNQLRQQGGVDLMIYPLDKLLAEIGKYFSLEDYDIVMTGTPAGVAGFERGDLFCGRIFNGDRLLIERKWIVE